MINELDRVVLTTDLSGKSLKAGDVGAVVMVDGEGEAFEVEFMTLNGDTFALKTVAAAALRPVTDQDVTHSRDAGTERARRSFDGDDWAAIGLTKLSERRR